MGTGSGDEHVHAPGVHAHICGGPDHHSGDYTPQQRQDLDLVLAFNRRMSDLINQGHDVAEVEAFMDPDPLRYMWVDEGQGRIPDMINDAHRVLDQAPPLAGHRRAGVDQVDGSDNAARPSIACRGDVRLVTWLEWEPGQGDVVRASLRTGAGEPSEPEAVSGTVADVFRPTAVVTTEGVPWVFFGRRDA
ncbi:hypothetical protein, partial [Ornithinicoccus halotolerans]|uniref:hypothetical protein n=1 Tax=Ornithinicoccus halotolerans TaxID=1748220 RepID=UPI00129509E0